MAVIRRAHAIVTADDQLVPGWLVGEGRFEDLEGRVWTQAEDMTWTPPASELERMALASDEEVDGFLAEVRGGRTMTYDADDQSDAWNDADFVLGAVLAAIEDLTLEDRRRVLTEALAAVEHQSGEAGEPLG